MTEYWTSPNQFVEKVLVGWKWCRNQWADNTTLGQTNMDSRTCTSISRTMPAHYTYCFMIPASYYRCIQIHNNKPSSSICFFLSYAFFLVHFPPIVVSLQKAKAACLLQPDRFQLWMQLAFSFLLLFLRYFFLVFFPLIEPPSLCLLTHCSPRYCRYSPFPFFFLSIPSPCCTFRITWPQYTMLVHQFDFFMLVKGRTFSFLFFITVPLSLQ
jgi:hypothetical protein